MNKKNTSNFLFDVLGMKAETSYILGKSSISESIECYAPDLFWCVCVYVCTHACELLNMYFVLFCLTGISLSYSGWPSTHSVVQSLNFLLYCCSLTSSWN